MKTSSRTITLEAPTLEELDKLVHRKRLSGYYPAASFTILPNAGLRIYMLRRDDYTNTNWRWTDRDFQEFKCVLKDIPLSELNFQTVSDKYIPERSRFALWSKFKNICKDVYGISHEEFSQQRRQLRRMDLDRVRKPRRHVSKHTQRKLDTVTRAVKVIEGDISSPEVIMIRGEVYVKQKAAQ